MKAYLAWVVVTVGLLGCGAQALPGGSHDAGRDLNLDDAGCPPEGKMTCPPLWCSDGVVPEPECIHGAWSCESLAFADPISCPCGPVPSACSCDPSSGVISCPIDASAGTDGGHDAGAVKDGGASCPPWPADGGRPTCGCGSDTISPPRCLDGAWTCPPGSSGLQICPPCSNQLPPPPGCRCNPANGALTCAHDAGADAPSD